MRKIETGGCCELKSEIFNQSEHSLYTNALLYTIFRKPHKNLL